MPNLNVESQAAHPLDKPLTSVWLMLFRLWLYAPVALLCWVVLGSLRTEKDYAGGMIPAVVIVVASASLALMVLFGKDFRRFERVTTYRILLFFAFLFIVAEAFVLAWSMAKGEFGPSIYLLITPILVALTFTPFMVILFDFPMPKRR